MVLSQFVGERPLSIRAIVPGVLIWLTFVALALPLTKEGRGG
jgi:hypothetical protein